ncbi:MAG: TraB/GumN family protein [Prevotellaceae bacterium]|jgi:uncharacterized protein YbaP (TraB family)|nr:TraB/GumN family protein [Prevotellaceae bacterium]
MNTKLKKRIIDLFTGSFLFIVIIACVSAEEFKTSDRFSLLWEITGNDLQNPSYLYGTIHIYDTNIFKLPKEIYEAIDRCDNFSLEIDMNNIDQSMLMQRVFIGNPDSTLDKLLEPEIYAEIRTIPIIKMMGEQVKMFKPFFLQTYLLIDNPMTVQSVDLQLNEYAKTNKKNIFGIETMEEQLEMIDKIPLSEQAKSITEIYGYCKKENLGFHAAGKKIFGKVLNAYREQNIETIALLEKELGMISSSPGASDSVMIAERNVNMANRISDFIKQNKTLFAAVGALHLADYKNMNGVVSLLKEKGYKLRPILIKLYDSDNNQ